MMNNITTIYRHWETQELVEAFQYNPFIGSDQLIDPGERLIQLIGKDNYAITAPGLTLSILSQPGCHVPLGAYVIKNGKKFSFEFIEHFLRRYRLVSIALA